MKCSTGGVPGFTISKNFGATETAVSRSKPFSMMSAIAFSIFLGVLYRIASPQKSLDDCGQFYRKLIQICDIEEGIAIDALDILLVVTNCGGYEQNAFTLVFLLDTSQIFLSSPMVAMASPSLRC